MRIKLNKKILDSKHYKGSSEDFLEEICYNFLVDKRFQIMENIEVVHNYLLNITNKIINNILILTFEFKNLKNDRDKLEVVIEQYKFTKYLLSGDKRKYTEYLENLEQYEVFIKDKVLNTLVDYKLLRFGNEIFNEMGIEIIEKLDDNSYIAEDKTKFIN